MRLWAIGLGLLLQACQTPADRQNALLPFINGWRLCVDMSAMDALTAGSPGPSHAVESAFLVCQTEEMSLYREMKRMGWSDDLAFRFLDASRSRIKQDWLTTAMVQTQG